MGLHCLLCLWRPGRAAPLGGGTTFGFGAQDGAASLQPPPPNVALSEPLPGGIQGWLQAVSDMRTCGPAQRRSARWRSSDPTEQRKRSPGMVAKRRWTKTGQWCRRKRRNSAELPRWSEMAQQMATTIFNADGGRLEHQMELSKRWRVATRRKTFSGEESRRQMVVTG